ncbi:hypothetical protein AAFN83_19605 [Gorillibacterium sp. CAU 1737]
MDGSKTGEDNTALLIHMNIVKILDDGGFPERIGMSECERVAETLTPLFLMMREFVATLVTDTPGGMKILETFLKEVEDQ